LSGLLLNDCFRAAVDPGAVSSVGVAFRVEIGRPFAAALETIPSIWALHVMIKLARDANIHSLTRTGAQPIALAAVTLLIILACAASIALWRVYHGTSPDSDRLVATRQLQARTAQASEQLVEKTKGLEATQQESIDQLQMVQDQLQTVRRLLATQQTDTRRLSDQLSALTEAVNGLRQSYASAQTSEQPSATPSRNRSIRTRAAASRAGQRHVRDKSKS
jgi:uncharacterized protein HemX